VVAFERHEGSASTDKEGVRNYTRVFRVYTGNASFRPEWGIVGVAINRYDAYPSDAGALAVSADSVPVQGELGWFDVTYSYTSKPFEANAGDNNEPGQTDPAQQPNPILRTPTIRFGANTRMVPFLLDWRPAGLFDECDRLLVAPRRAVANSAGQMFEGQEVEDITGVITVNYNVAPTTNIATKQKDYVNKVNDADFAILPVYGTYDTYCLRCNSWGGTLQFEADYGWYISAEVEFEFKPETWKREYIDQGYYYRDAYEEIYVPGVGTEKVLRKFRDNATGQPIDAPRYLDGCGGPLPAGENPVKLTFYPYKAVSFTNIFA
jgi:hypothetical protein